MKLRRLPQEKKELKQKENNINKGRETTEGTYVSSPLFKKKEKNRDKNETLETRVSPSAFCYSRFVTV